MSDTAAAQLRRILHLIPQIADGEEHAVEDVAARLGVSRKVLFDDLVSLATRFDEPGGFVEGVSLTWDDETVTAFTAHFHRPMRLSMRELCALELGLAVLRRERTPEEHPPIDRALERLREAITRLPTNDRLEGVHHAELDAPGMEWLPIVHRALERRRKLRIRYRSGSATEPTTRTVCPYGVVFAQGMWYVVAHCDTSDGLRVFRLDRMEAVEREDDPYDVPADFSLDDVLAGERVFRAERPTTMTVRYSPRIARWIGERENLSPDPDGSITVEHPVADVHWAVRRVMQYGPDAEVLSPPELREAVRERVIALAAAVA